jgi:hypothetical protein
VWALALFLVTSSLATAHWYALPRPDHGDPRLRQLLATPRASADGRWLAVHTLYAHCRCSQRIVEHLLRRGALADVTERVVMVGRGDAMEAALRDAGFGLSSIPVGELKKRYGVTSVPLLIVADPSERVRYAAGYTTRQQGPDVRDVSIIRELMSDHEASELPVFGCALSRALQRTLDPLGLKGLGDGSR